MQIININTNQKINIDFQPTKGNLIAYNYYPDYIEVPIELYDKEVIVVDGVVVEKPLDISAIKLQGIDFLTSKILEKKKEKFIVSINKAGDGSINIETDLQDSTLNQWIVVKNTIPQDLKDNENNIIVTNVRFVHLTHAEEPYLDEFVPITEEELLRLNTFLTNTVNNLTQTIVNISNMIKTAPDELVIQVFNMTPEEKDAYAQSIIEQYTPQI